MKTIILTFRQCALALILSMLWSASQALENYARFGTILHIGSNSITVEDVKYRLAPALIVDSTRADKSTLADFKVGDTVLIEVMVLDRVHYIQRMLYHKKVEG